MCVLVDALYFLQHRINLFVHCRNAGQTVCVVLLNDVCALREKQTVIFENVTDILLFQRNKLVLDQLLALARHRLELRLQLHLLV